MKKLFLFSLLFICISIQAQYQYQTTLWFETANGTRDSVVIGNHPDATPGVDTLLGEVALNKDSVGFVWASKMVSSNGRPDTAIFLKKQLVSKDTTSKHDWRNSPITICYTWDSLPLSIYWDENFFADDSVKMTLFTSFAPCYAGPMDWEFFEDRLYLWEFVENLPQGMTLQNDSAMMYGNWADMYYHSGYGSRIDSTNNFIFVTFASIWDDTGFVGLENVSEYNDMNVFVNSETISIKNEDDAVMSNVYIYSTEGRVVVQQIGIGSSETTINASRLPKGVYVVVADTKQGQRKQKVAI